MRSSALLSFENDDKFCFIWSILASLHPKSDSKIGRPTNAANYKQYFIQLNIQGFDFSNGFRCSDVHRPEKLINLSTNLFELNFCQDQYQWKHKLFPIKISRNNSHRVVYLFINKNHYVLIKK